MPLEILPSFLFFCFVGAITPGPANLCSLAAALNGGRKQALRQLRGLFAGFWIDSLSAVAITWAVGTALNEYVSYLSWIGAAYILWLAFKLLRESFSSSAGASAEESNGNAQGTKESYTFLSGLVLNLTNVKVILYCITSLSVYVLPYVANADSMTRLRSLLLVGIFLPFTGPMCNLVWIIAGVALQRLFREHRKPVNIALALSLAFCAYSLVHH